MSTERFTGRVKWFNNKAGYGFITVTDGPKSGTDVFVHHSAIKVDSEQYKYLVQGEYIEFSLSDTKTDTHQFQAGEVSGINGGKLMCETRRDSRSSRTQYQDSSDSLPVEPVKMPRSVAAPRQANDSVKGGEWTYVAKDSTTQNSSAGRGQGRGSSGRGSTGRGSTGRGSSGRGSSGRGSSGRGQGSSSL
jgi:CspA family cold shock protein